MVGEKISGRWKPIAISIKTDAPDRGRRGADPRLQECWIAHAASDVLEEGTAVAHIPSFFFTGHGECHADRAVARRSGQLDEARKRRVGYELRWSCPAMWPVKLRQTRRCADHIAPRWQTIGMDRGPHS